MYVLLLLQLGCEGGHPQALQLPLSDASRHRAQDWATLTEQQAQQAFTRHSRHLQVSIGGASTAFFCKSLGERLCVPASL